eukprot:Platyproteum_vivax@DN5703_c0_g1_i1.p1
MFFVMSEQAPNPPPYVGDPWWIPPPPPPPRPLRADFLWIPPPQGAAVRQNPPLPIERVAPPPIVAIGQNPLPPIEALVDLPPTEEAPPSLISWLASQFWGMCCDFFHGLVVLGKEIASQVSIAMSF